MLDGATGTALQAVNLTADDFGGPDLEGCNEMLCATRPDVVAGVHERYLARRRRHRRDQHLRRHARSSSPSTTSPTAPSSSTQRAARIAREACARFDTPGRLRFVCGSMGPTTKAISVTGGVTFEELRRAPTREQARGLMAGGADYLLLETCQDTRNIKAGLLGIADAFEAAGWNLPVAVSVTIETTGTMLAGQDAEALAVSLLHQDLLYVGLNCATGPELMSDHLRTLSETARTRIACVPNAGLPDEEGHYHEGPDQFRQVLRPLPRRRLAQPGRRLLRHHRRSRRRAARSGRRASAAPARRSTSGRWCPGSRRSSSPSTTARCWWARRPTSSAAASSAT